MIITAELLRRLGCCSGEMSRFAWRWPEGCEVTIENVIEAHRLGFTLTAILIRGWVPRELEIRFREEYQYLGPNPWRVHPNAVAALYVTLAEVIEGPFPWPNDTAEAWRRKSLD